ncbi:MAG TPA: PepSY-associated TM helix domain-containing protein [Nitrospirales bacterium]|nr:PepSY-associated TM helix domain-containing protein [Nitrospirales bacterium]
MSEPHAHSSGQSELRTKGEGRDRDARNRRRTFWLKIHRYLGLIPGAVFAIIGLTGSILAFWPELEVWLHPGLWKVNPQEEQFEFRPLDEIVAAANTAIPSDGTPYALVFPRMPDTAFMVSYSRPAPNPEQLEWHQVFIDPQTAQIKGQHLRLDLERPWRGTFFDFVLRVHSTLALGARGSTVVGVLALLLLVSLLSGLILWWPSFGQLSGAFTIKRGAGRIRRVYDLHKTLGLYTSMLLVVALSSGLYLVFPDFGKNLIGMFSAITLVPEDLASRPLPGEQPIGFDRAAAIANGYYADGRFQWIFFPQGQEGFYRIVKKEPHERTDILPARALWIDQYSGQILHTYDPEQFTAGDTFERWLFPLHSGEAFGLPGRIGIMILGLVPTILFVTGLMRWKHKRKKRNLPKMFRPTTSRKGIDSQART